MMTDVLYTPHSCTVKLGLKHSSNYLCVLRAWKYTKKGSDGIPHFIQKPSGVRLGQVLIQSIHPN